MDENRIKGRFIGRGETATFIPEIYVERQKNEIIELIESTGVISLDRLKKYEKLLQTPFFQGQLLYKIVPQNVDVRITLKRGNLQKYASIRVF